MVPPLALVTGSTGFLGRHLCSRLEAAGVPVLAPTRADGFDLEAPGAFAPYEREPVSVVYHLAGRTFVPDSWREPASFYRANTLGTQQVLDFCRATGARLIHVSAYIYGQPQYLPIDEAHPVVPSNPYAHSKWLAEELCRFYSANHGVPCVILRPFNLYGSGQREPFLIPSLLAQALAGETIRIQHAAPRRDYLHVEDIIEVLILAARSERPFSVYNAGSGRSYSVIEVIEALGVALGQRLAWTSDEQPRPHEIMDVVANTRALQEDLGWSPRVPLETGLRRLLEPSMQTRTPR